MPNNKELVEAYRKQTSLITKEATDIVNCPVVMDGYIQSGKPSSMVFMNLQGMAQSRVRKYFMLSDPTDPVFQRVIAEIKKICAMCIKHKYETRAKRISYNHIQDADRLTKLWMQANLDNVRKEYLKLTEVK